MIIFINGSINAGKTTVSKIIASKIENSAVVEIDRFHEFIEWMPIVQAVPLNLKNAISVIMNFVNEGLNVIVPYPLSQKNYQLMAENLRGLKTEIHYFTLAPKLEAVLKNRGNRELDDWERGRIKHHYEIGIHQPVFGVVIDNTAQSPEETAQGILKMLNIE